MRDPLGQKQLFETEIKELRNLMLENIRLKGKQNQLPKLFVVNNDKNMVVPFHFALKVLN